MALAKITQHLALFHPYSMIAPDDVMSAMLEERAIAKSLFQI